MKKCKHCQGTEFGVLVKSIQQAPFRMKDGQPVGGPLGEPQTSQEVTITHCFGCNKPITEEDTYEGETCVVCGETVDKTNKGKCPKCEAQAKKLASMTKDELINMMLRGEIPHIHAMASQEGKSVIEPKVEQPKEVKPEPVPVVEEKVEVQQVKENVIINTAVDVPTEEIDANLMVAADKGAENLDEIIDTVDAIDVVPPDALSEDDILAQLDSAVDIGTLDLMNEDVNLPI